MIKDLNSHQAPAAYWSCPAVMSLPAPVGREWPVRCFPKGTADSRASPRRSTSPPKGRRTELHWNNQNSWNLHSEFNNKVSLKFTGTSTWWEHSEHPTEWPAWPEQTYRQQSYTPLRLPLQMTGWKHEVLYVQKCDQTSSRVQWPAKVSWEKVDNSE